MKLWDLSIKWTSGTYATYVALTWHAVVEEIGRHVHAGNIKTIIIRPSV